MSLFHHHILCHFFYTSFQLRITLFASCLVEGRTKILPIFWYEISFSGTWNTRILYFHWHNPFGRSKTLGSTQRLTEMSTRNISWRVKAVCAYGWQHYHPHVPIVLKSGSLNLPEPSGPVQVCTGIALPVLFTFTRAVYGPNIITIKLHYYLFKLFFYILI